MSGSLYLDLDLAELRAVGHELQASEQQIRFALNRAMQRTATTLRTMSGRGLANELQLRAINLLRKRLRTLRLRAGKDGSIALWYGLNDLPASWFKGTPKQTADGATHRGQSFPGAFVGRSKFKGRKTILKRAGKGRLPVVEQNLEIEDRAVVFIEDQIFDKAHEIFWQHFKRDLRSRVAFAIGE